MPGEGKGATVDLTFSIDPSVFWSRFGGSVCINCCLNIPLAFLLYKTIWTTTTMRVTHFYYANSRKNRLSSKKLYTRKLGIDPNVL